MSAIRYSGNVRARVTLLEDHSAHTDYRVCARILHGPAQDKGRAFLCTVSMNVEHGRGYGTDAPRAFDEAAECGLRLLSAEHSALLVALGFDGESDLKVTRRPTAPALLAIEHDSGAPHGHLCPIDDCPKCEGTDDETRQREGALNDPPTPREPTGAESSPL